MITLVLVLLLATSNVKAACEYQIGKIEMKTCKGKPVDIWTLTGFEAEFTEDCSILAKGCAKLHTDLQSIVTEYKAFKDGMKISDGKYEVCGMTLFDTKFECPLAKDKRYCSTKNWVTKVPKTLLPMAVGKLKGEVTLKTSAGVFCYIITTQISRK